MDIRAQYLELRNEIDAAVRDVFEESAFILGNRVASFENELASYCGTSAAVGVASGTDALVLVLDAWGIGPGDEVITSPFTFFATAEAIMRVGATPVFVDVDPVTFNIDPAAVEAAVTPRTKAIVPVHIFGQPAEMDTINAIAKKHGLAILEDACQAIGSEYRGKRAGALGDAAAFSFFPTKNLGGAGDGGAVTTNDTELAARVKLLRVHGSSRKYFHDLLGYNSRLDALQAAVLSVKLRKLDEWNERRRQAAALYAEVLADTPLVLPKEAKGVKHVYHLYVVRVPDGKRDELERFLSERGIGCGVYYPLPLHLQAACAALGYARGSLPEAERASTETLALPMSAHLSESQIGEVAEAVRAFFAR